VADRQLLGTELDRTNCVHCSFRTLVMCT